MKQGVLAGLLAVQLVIVAAVWGLRSTASDDPDAFLTFDVDSVDTLLVADAQSSVELSKGTSGWRLPEDLPADSDKVTEVLEKLADASGGWPVATTASAAERFEVTEEKFQRHIVASAGDEVIADVFLGTSPSFRKVHARHADGGPVHAINFSNYEAGTGVSTWLDKSLLRPEGDVQAFERVGAFALTKSEEGWTANDGAELDQSEVDTLVGRFTGLNVLDASDVDLPTEPKLQFAIKDAAGTQTLSIYHHEEDGDYVATSDRVGGRFEISTYIAEQLDVSLGDLAPEQEDAEEVTETPTDEAEPS